MVEQCGYYARLTSDGHTAIWRFVLSKSTEFPAAGAGLLNASVFSRLRSDKDSPAVHNLCENSAEPNSNMAAMISFQLTNGRGVLHTFLTFTLDGSSG